MFRRSWVVITTFSAIFALHGITEAASTAQRGNSRIFGGEDAEHVDIPYIILLTTSYLCGGFILNERTVVTAAHCLEGFKPQDFKVHAGLKSRILKEGVVVGVEAVYTHPRYGNGSWEFDIGLLRLSQPLPFGPTIQPIQLAPIGQSVKDGSLAMVAGWGATEESGLSSKMLRYAHVPIVSQEQCRKLYKRPITDNMLCAGNLKVGTYLGDSGGPLVYKNKVIGVVSFGKLFSKAGVYARVSALRPWVEEILQNKYNEKIN